MTVAAVGHALDPANDALHQRLVTAARTLGLPTEDAVAADERAVSVVFGRLVDHVHADRAPSSLWLLITALAAAMPVSADFEAAARSRQLDATDDFARHLLELCHAIALDAGSPTAQMDVVQGATVVDVDFSARHDLHTGIQRVVRETVPRWARDHDITLVAWTGPGGAFRRLTGQESDRVLAWGRRAASLPADTSSGSSPRLVVPWGSDVLLPENTAPESCPALVAMAVHSGNRVGAIGYDCIPAISPELIHEGLPDRFMRYLEAVKHADVVAGISEAAAEEFRGFADMVAAQGLPGPRVVTCVLPVEVPSGSAAVRQGPPLVVSIGSFEPRKNQLAVLTAAEHLWREGLDFELQFIGGGGWPTAFDALMRRLTRAGRPVRRRTAITDDDLWSTLRSARFSVFASLHEGFGLPVAESLACGTPCLTSDRGSTAEIAAGGGALIVDPLDDIALADQMRRLLTDDDLVTDLQRAAAARPPRTWDDYAHELWGALSRAGETEGADRP